MLNGKKRPQARKAEVKVSDLRVCINPEYKRSESNHADETLSVGGLKIRSVHIKFVSYKKKE